MAEDIWIIGAGGHAKVVIDAWRAAGGWVKGVLDEDPNRDGDVLLGVPVRAPFDPATVASEGVDRAVLAIGSNETRRALAASILGVTWQRVIHPSAYVAPSARIGAGSVVFARAVVQPDAVVGAHAILNTGCSVDHDCALGDFVHVAPGARLAGGVTLEAGALAGIGSAVVPGRRVGAWATIGAGAAVVADVPAGVVARGVPARWPGG